MILLCKEKINIVFGFSIKSFEKAMGATYKTSIQMFQKMTGNCQVRLRKVKVKMDISLMTTT